MPSSGLGFSSDVDYHDENKNMKDNKVMMSAVLLSRLADVDDDEERQEE